MGLTVAFTGPTCDIGISAARALERVPGVDRIIGMACRPFYPAEHLGSREQSARVNLEGTFSVFEATVAAGLPRRLVYTSSVAAYGYHSDRAGVAACRPHIVGDAHDQGEVSARVGTETQAHCV